MNYSPQTTGDFVLLGLVVLCVVWALVVVYILFPTRKD